MNKFNKRQGSAVKAKKIKGREIKKRVGAAKKHKDIVKVSSGQRTGKAAKKRERLQRLKEKDSLAAQGLLDAEMKDAPKL